MAMNTYLAYTSTFCRLESCWVSLSAKILGVIRFDGISISSLAKFCAPESNKPFWKSWCHVCKWDFSSLLKDSIKWKYCIYSINRPGRLLNCWTLIVGAYSRWALIRGWALIKFSPFSASVVYLFCNKIIKLMATTKSKDVTKQGFCKILWWKLCLREGLLLSLIGVCVEGSGVGLGAY